MTFIFKNELDRVTAVYRGESPTKAATQAQVNAGGPSDIPARCKPVVAAPDLQAAHNRAFGALVQQMVEFMQVFDYEDCLAALNAADQIDQEKQAAIDDECVRTR